MLESLKRRSGDDIKGGIYISCVARGPHMFGELNAEMQIVRSILGDVPVIGLYANGEISNNRLYSYTGVLTLFT
jgi:small ligand-binding sensory domain FIST